MALEIKNLTKKFSDKLIFDNFSYKFEDTGVYAIVGESGAGKTTLLRIIAGLDTDYSGEVTGGGIGNVSYAFQEYRLFPTLSALENLTLISFGSATRNQNESARNMLLALGFTDADMHLRPSALSGGMKQRVSIARALLKDAPLLLLDEATKELDRDNATAVLDAIRREGEKRAVILVTHNREDIDYLKARVLTLIPSK
ncbi:MAG: ATP-binding cassette domain-containing protein [Clostridia bacterium]|nr:ATP-binding cassette domain-containing protein [Clostridia bacterium]